MIRQAAQTSQTFRPASGAAKQMPATRRMRPVRPSLSNHIRLQRKCASGAQCECEECGKERQVRLRRYGAQKRSSDAAPDAVHQALRGPGRLLDGTTRTEMESRFGENFRDVRVHTDDRAAQSASMVDALAYTVGAHVVFGAQQYAPGSSAGRRLLAHELVHVVQQRGAAAAPDELQIGAPGDRFEREADAIAADVMEAKDTATVELRMGSARRAMQRDLATPPPATAPKAQKDLTSAQIQEAINFNKARYDEANTKLIQGLLGGPVTGTWTEDNIVAIAATQEEYGLHKDGKIGHNTFLFLNREQSLEGISTKTENCLVSFLLIGPDPQNFGRDDPANCHHFSHFRIEAEFSPRCNCAEFEYRQFIAGRLRRTRGGVQTDLPITEPGGVLPNAFIEDTDTTAAVQHYGHRADASEGPGDHYFDAAGNDDQAHGCRFASEDTPGAQANLNCLAGDSFDRVMRFRGEIRRNGVVVQTKFWTALNLTNWQP